MHERYAGARTGRGDLFGNFGRRTTAYGGARFVLIFSASRIRVHHCPGVQARNASVHPASGARARRRQNGGGQPSTLADLVQESGKAHAARSHDDYLRSAGSRRVAAAIAGGSVVSVGAPPPSLPVENG